MASSSGLDERRQRIREEFWPDEDAWTGGEHDKGWFKAPRTLPLILTLMRSKDLSGTSDPSNVYLELLSRQFGDGVVEIQNEAEHAYAAGYSSTRAVRTWQDLMRCLEKLGFIKIKGIGKNAFKYVLIVHPATVIKRLQDDGNIPQEWLDAYRDRRTQTKELSYEERLAVRSRSKIVALGKGKTG
jgi:hypothetical protein